MSITEKILKSWSYKEGNVHTTKELVNWIQDLNKNTYVSIQEQSILNDTFWFYDDYNGEVLNRKRSFFSVKGMRRFEDGEFIGEQPIIIQPEIGYLGIIVKEIDGVLNFLMQAKIEPGNINTVQISPTIQATKSNFTRAHGGKLPAYFELFERASDYNIIYDQIQSEQATRFYKKRNRNIIIDIGKAEIEILPNFKWMTLGQIKELMHINNLVNMDTRTVLSGLPLYEIREEHLGVIDRSEKLGIFKEIMGADNFSELSQVFQLMNNLKMFKNIKNVTIPLNELVDWEVNEFGITCKKQAPFMVRYYKIEIEGREVQSWTQPLFKAIGKATFGLLTTLRCGERKFLIKMRPEFGSFDKVEMGPTIQWEATHYLYNDDVIEKLFREKLEKNQGILNDVILSEEGGRFYHEQNRNVIIQIEDNELASLPEGYIWVGYKTLNLLVQFNNILNIQLRNLISIYG